MLRKIFSLILFILMASVYGQVGKVSLDAARSVAVPKLLNYQGYLTDTVGIPITDTLGIDMTFKIFDAETGGNELWTEDTTLPVESGIFHAILGCVNEIPDSVFTKSTDRWLQTNVEGESLDRTRITSAAYAYVATHSDTAEYAKTGPGVADNDWTISDDDMYSGVSGNVGIGTMYPIAKLDVYTIGGTALWLHTEDTLNTALFARHHLDSDRLEIPRWGPPPGAIFGISSNYSGVYGHAGPVPPYPLPQPGVGVYGESPVLSGIGVKGQAGPNGWGLYSEGDAKVDGNLTVTGEGTFSGYGNNYFAGNVAIGTTSPDGAKLDVFGTATIGSGNSATGICAVAMGCSTNASGFYSTAMGKGTTASGTYSTAMGSSTEASGDNSASIGQYLTAGPGSHTIVIGKGISPDSCLVNNIPNSFMVGFNATTPTLFVDGNNVGIGTTSPDAKLTVKGDSVLFRGINESGDTVVTIGEGLDYAETFPISDDKISPGMVVVIDTRNTGDLTISTQAYDTKVVGIVSGAKGLGSGVRLGAQEANGHAVALAGRVYCRVDTKYGDIEPGDLLTTSPTPGHAMVVRDLSKAQGAILGKSMESLSGGIKGQILTLVTLQ